MFHRFLLAVNDIAKCVLHYTPKRAWPWWSFSPTDGRHFAELCLANLTLSVVANQGRWMTLQIRPVTESET